MKITIDTEKLERLVKAQYEYSQMVMEFNAYIADVILQATEQH